MYCSSKNILNIVLIILIVYLMYDLFVKKERFYVGPSEIRGHDEDVPQIYADTENVHSLFD